MRGAAAAALSVSALGVVLIACGDPTPAPREGSGNVGFDLYISRAAVDDIGAFQLALVKDGTAHSCTELQRQCLRENVDRSGLVPIEDAEGRSLVALMVSAELSSGTPRTQDVTLRNVPTGKGYLLVIEALSKGTPPRFLGASCTPRIDVNSGNNERVTAQPIVFVQSPADGGTADAGIAGTDCDPRYDR